MKSAIMKSRTLNVMLMSWHFSEEKGNVSIVPVLFHLNFSLPSSPNPDFSLWKSSTKTTMTTPIWGQTARNLGWKRPPLLPSHHLCPWVFFWQEHFTYFLRSQVAVSRVFPGNTEREGSCFPHVLPQGIRHFFPLPVWAVPTPASDQVKTGRAATWSLPEPPERV